MAVTSVEKFRYLNPELKDLPDATGTIRNVFQMPYSVQVRYFRATEC